MTLRTLFCDLNCRSQKSYIFIKYCSNLEGAICSLRSSKCAASTRAFTKLRNVYYAMWPWGPWVYTLSCNLSLELEGIDCMNLVWFGLIWYCPITWNYGKNLQSVTSAHSNSTTEVSLIILLIGHMPIGVHFHMAITSMKNESASQWKGS